MGFKHFNLGAKTQVLVHKKLTLRLSFHSEAVVMATRQHQPGPGYRSSFYDQITGKLV